ncbi:MAG: ribonuclease III [Lachnospiraceae bacterium]|nr:ribonuclease III [Lachnospiraceae bacterium]
MNNIMSGSEKIKAAEERIGYSFNDRQLLRTALTHSSYANEHKKSGTGYNERLEFLGDAVLELASSDFIFKEHPQMPEGQMSRKRASMVCEPALAYAARSIGLGELLLLGHGEDMAGGRERDSILSDAFEAVIGAIYLDGGLEPASSFIHKFVLVNEKRMEQLKDNKTILQELLQKENHETVQYELIGSSGPEHDRTFIMQVSQGGRVLGSGSGRTKQAAGQAAAGDAIQKLKGL